VADPEAVKPEDWDDEEDGEWEAPIIENPKCEAGNCGAWVRPQKPNPDYKGKWAPPLIDNPNYSGVWSPRKIPNPDFYEDKTPFTSLLPISAVGIEMWTMTKDIMFDNIILTDSKTVADDWAAESWNKKALIEILNAPGDSPMDKFLTYAGENPWIWVLLAAAVILPVVFYVYCSGGSPAPVDDGAEAKKTDKVTPDDDEKEGDKGEEEEEGEQNEEDEDMPELEETEKKEEEEEEAAAEEEEAEEEAAEEEVEEVAEETEEAPVKRRTRKAD